MRFDDDDDESTGDSLTGAWAGMMWLGWAGLPLATGLELFTTSNNASVHQQSG